MQHGAVPTSSHRGSLWLWPPLLATLIAFCQLPPNSRVVWALLSEDLEVEQSIQSGHSDQILERVVKAQLWLWLLVQM